MSGIKCMEDFLAKHNHMFENNLIFLDDIIMFEQAMIVTYNNKPMESVG